MTTQHDYVLDDQVGATFLPDINAMAAAIVSNNEGATAPTPTYAYMLWADTANDQLKMRNAANSGWIVKGSLSDVYFGLLSLAGGTMTGALNEKGFTVAAHATTCDIWTGGNFGTLTGSVVTFTDVADAPIADAWRLIRSNAAHILTNNANITVQGGANKTLADGTLMLWHALTTSTFEVFILNADGTAVVSSSIGVGQTWQLVTRSSGVTYTNSTGKSIELIILYASGSSAFQFTVDAVTFPSVLTGPLPTGATLINIIIPDGSTYSFTYASGITAYELR